MDELVRYLSDERSGALRFGGFGAHWPKIREAARMGTLHRGSRGVNEFVTRWDQFLRHLSLLLSEKSGTTVEAVTSAAHRRDPERRTRDLLEQLVTQQKLDGVLRVPNVAADLNLSVDFRARQLQGSVTLQAPRRRKRRAGSTGSCASSAGLLTRCKLRRASREVGQHPS